MLMRAVIAFLVLPGLVAFGVPALWLWFQGSLEPVYKGGALVVLVGVFGLAWCVRDFYVSGKGTLAPWSPPSELVVVGLYRYSRNPMYIAVLVIVLGWSMLFASVALLGYCMAIALGFHLRVVRGEEPWLARTHGARWEQYRRQVPRWIGAL
jgi:protein-S-isoprenylcysteine O-methyltransferase Ste14